MVPSQLLSAAEQLSVFTYIATARASDSEAKEQAKQTNTKFNRHLRNSHAGVHNTAHNTQSNSSDMLAILRAINSAGVPYSQWRGVVAHDLGGSAVTARAVSSLNWADLGKEVAEDVQRWTKDKQKVSRRCLCSVGLGCAHCALFLQVELSAGESSTAQVSFGLAVPDAHDHSFVNPQPPWGGFDSVSPPTLHAAPAAAVVPDLGSQTQFNFSLSW